MTKYKCGCVSKGMILISKNIIDMLTYNEWSEGVGVFGTKELCLYCYLEKENIKFHGHCGYTKGKWLK